MSVLPDRLDFAQEVRAERLSLLWKVTLVLALFFVWGTLILTSLSATSPSDLFLPIVFVTLGCLLCRALLRAGEARGIKQFRASVLADNPRMLDMLARFGDIRERRLENGVVELLFSARPTPPAHG